LLEPLYELTAAGTVADFHGIPSLNLLQKNQYDAKINIFFKTNEKYLIN